MALSHLASLGIVHDGPVGVSGTRAVEEHRLWLVGYGDRTGYASAALVGVGRTARSTLEEIDRVLSSGAESQTSAPQQPSGGDPGMLTDLLAKSRSTDKDSLGSYMLKTAADR